MRFLDLFAGIGGFRLALERAGHKCIGFCEIDKFARQTYKANFDTKGEVEWHDITTVTDEDVRQLGSVDIITGGFPCQAFSVAGKRGGFDDTRGTLFFEIARIARILQPRYLLLENVKGLLNHAGGETFSTILNTLGELGYWVEWQILNSKDFGVPQNRERVFIIGHLGGEPRRKVFPITRSSGQAIKQIGNLIDTDSFGGNPQRGRVYSPEGISPTLTTMQGGGLKPKIAIPVLTPDRLEKRQNGRRFKEPGEPMFTLTAQDRHGVLVSQRTDIKEVEVSCTLDANYYKGLGSNQERTGVLEFFEERADEGMRFFKDGMCGTLRAMDSGGDKRVIDTTHDGVRIRRLTPLECFRLQGFPDEFFYRAKAIRVSDRQLYIQAGNAVTVNVVYEIAKRLW